MKKEEIDKKTNIENTHVPDKVYAYIIQSHHMLYELLDCKDGDCVSVEVFDDVGVEHENGCKEAIQLKSALSDRNPVSDKAVDLWKTMYNWLISIEAGELNPENTKFVLFINVDKQGNVVNTFHSSDKLEEAVIAWETSKKVFYDNEGKLKSIGDEYKKYIEYFFDKDKKEVACKIIQNFKLKRCIENYSTTVRKKFEISGIPEDIIDPIYTGIIGWIDVKVTHMVENGEAIIIPYRNYQKELRALYREYNQKYSLMAYSKQPSRQAVQRELQGQRTYIAQLDIIDCDFTEKLEAINDYLRASTDRTIWAEKGVVSLQSLQSYEERLKRSWKVNKRIVMLERKNDSLEDQGKMIYYKCQDKKIDMDTVSVPDFFQNGCYHSLSDNLEIGWHPQYIDEIKKEKKVNWGD